MIHCQRIATLFSKPSGDGLPITGVCTDSRLVQPGNVFVAIVGERFDGHAYAQEAQAKGAVALVVNRQVAGVTIPQYEVQDTLKALAQIATLHRESIDCPVIALTGSNGKTTVKEMIAAILPKPAHATKGNLNNHIGAPLSVLDLKPEHRFAVFELGANHAGEIAYTVAMVKPDVALINNIAPAHIEGFGSIDGVAKAKGEIYQGLKNEGLAVINDDDAYAHFWDTQLENKKVVRFSAQHPADIYAQAIALNAQGCAHFVLVTPAGQHPITLQVPGLHAVHNALAAAACCYAVGIALATICQGLSSFTGVKGRLTFLTGKNQATLIDDTYNANLRSMLTALDVLATRPGKKIVVFGDMGELGPWAQQHHQEVGVAARALGIDKLFTCGTYSAFASAAFGDGGQHFATHEGVITSLLPEMAADTTVLVKGSRASAMEKIVDKLL